MSLAHSLGVSEGQQFPPSRGDPLIPPPSMQDVMRQCRPSRELLAFLCHKATELAKENNTEDAATLLLLAMCVREVVT